MRARQTQGVAAFGQKDLRGELSCLGIDASLQAKDDVAYELMKSGRFVIGLHDHDGAHPHSLLQPVNPTGEINSRDARIAIFDQDTVEQD